MAEKRFIATRIPEDTFKGLQLNAGVLLFRFDISKPTEIADEDIICATTGGISIDCKATYSDLGEDVDNCPKNIKYYIVPSNDVSGSLTTSRFTFHPVILLFAFQLVLCAKCAPKKEGEKW